jgi:hypothetical protein
MSTLMFSWLRAALLGSVVAGLAACGSSGTSAATTSGGTECTPGKQEECACVGGTKGVQSCKADGSGLNECQCGSTTSSTGTGGAGGMSTGTMGPMCGDGVQQAGECDPSSEGHIYCAADCDSMTTSSSSGTGGAGGSCAGQLTYAGPVDSVTSVWVSGGLSGLKAGDDMCQNANLGADHVCDYEEVLKAQKAGELANVKMGTTAWVQRTTPALVNGVMSAPGPGGRCNDWKYNTNHISDGEYVTFDMVGQPTFHLDNDTIFDGMNPGVHTIPGDLECNGATRSILCCYTICK